VGGLSAHAVIVCGKIIPHAIGTDIYHRVGKKLAHPMKSPRHHQAPGAFYIVLPS